MFMGMADVVTTCGNIADMYIRCFNHICNVAGTLGQDFAVMIQYNRINEYSKSAQGSGHVLTASSQARKVSMWCRQWSLCHYSDVIMGVMESQITSLTIRYSTVYSGAVQRKHQSSASLAFVRGFHRSPVKSPHKWPVTRKTFPFDDVIMR